MPKQRSTKPLSGLPGARVLSCARPYGVPGASLVSLARVAVGIGPAVEPQLREAPVMNEGSCVGLDVHARSVVAGVIDVGSGEVRSLRVPPRSDATVTWLKTLPAPVRVVYEAGPTGYGLAQIGRAHV